jgi:hypothetical protein
MQIPVPVMYGTAVGRMPLCRAFDMLNWPLLSAHRIAHASGGNLEQFPPRSGVRVLKAEGTGTVPVRHDETVTLRRLQIRKMFVIESDFNNIQFTLTCTGTGGMRFPRHFQHLTVPSKFPL